MSTLTLVGASAAEPQGPRSFDNSLHILRHLKLLARLYISSAASFDANRFDANMLQSHLIHATMKMNENEK